jgi:hypothetical protein
MDKQALSLGGVVMTVWALAVFTVPVLASTSPVIYSYTVSSGNPTSATSTITWTTNIPSTSFVNYGLTTGYGTSSSSPILTTAHSIILGNLSPATTYHYALTSVDGSGNSTTSPDYTFTTVVKCDIYFDSVNGNDANTGSTSNYALQHLAASPAIASGQTVCLRRGSTFYDSIFGGVPGIERDNVTIRDYGPANLPKPMIDNSDVIPAGSWTSLGGNEYQATVTGPGTSQPTPYGSSYPFYSAGTNMINVFECKQAPCLPPSQATGTPQSDNDLVNVSSQSAVGTTPGSYYVDNMNATTMNIYIHPSDGTSPISSNYIYSYSHRLVGAGVNGLNGTIMNIASKKTPNNSGNIVQNFDGGSGTFIGVESDQGNKHNLFCSSGCTITGSTFEDGYTPNQAGGGGDTMIVMFDDVGHALPWNVSSSTFSNAIPNQGVAVDATHYGSGTPFGPMNFTGITAQGIGGAGLAGVTGGGVGGAFTVNNYLALNLLANSAFDVEAPATIGNNVQVVGPQSGHFTPVATYGGSNNLSLTLNNLKSCNLRQNGIIQANGTTGLNLTVASSTVYMPWYGVFVAPFGSTNFSNITFNNNVFDGNPAYPGNPLYGSGTVNTYTGNFNDWVLAGGDLSDIANVALGSYAQTLFTVLGPSGTLGTWQASTSQDMNSITTAPAVSSQTIACTVPTYTFTGPSSGTVNSTSGTYTVTPGPNYSTGNIGGGEPIGFVGTITLSPTGSGSTGLVPVVLNFPNSASTTAQTFTVTPTATGTITWTPTNNGTLINPAALTYTVNSVAPYPPYGTPVAAAGNTTAAVSFYAPDYIGGQPVTGYTITSNPAGAVDSNSGSTALTHTMTGLSNGIGYTFTVTAANAAGTSPASQPSNQVTPSTLPTVTAQAASSIGATSAVLYGTIATDGGASSTVEGFAYGLTASYGATTTTIGTFGLGSFSATLSSLSCNTAYHYAPYTVNVSGTSTYPADTTFTTSVCPVAAAQTSSVSPAGSVSTSGGSVSSSQLAGLLAPSSATTAYLRSRGIIVPMTAANQKPVPQVASTAAPNFTHDLQMGDANYDVKALQIYLNTHGYVIATTGAGSPGHENGSFGPLTKKAVMKFQKAHNLPVTGFFGPRTRAMVGK